MKASLPDCCPSCRGGLTVRTLNCETCDTQIDGRFDRCRFCQLDETNFALLDLFLRCRGNVKDVERDLGVSYPTVRAKLDQLWVKLGYKDDPDAEAPQSAESIVTLLRDGNLSVDEAVSQLKSRHD